MACSKYVSTKETTNTARVVRLLLDPCTDMLRDVLRNYITELAFPAKLRSDILTIKPLLNASQRTLLYPQRGKFTGNYQDLDLSLLYILLRNIAGIPNHANGWGKTPNAGDRSISANIERIRNIRNTYLGHINQSSMPDPTFHSVWQEVRNIASEIVKGFGLTTDYVDLIDKLEKQTMDPEQEQVYLKRNDDTDKTVDDLTDQQQKLQEVQYQHGNTIDKHEERLIKQCQEQTEHGTAIDKHKQLLTDQGQVLTEHGTTITKHEVLITEQSQKQTEHGATIVKHEKLLTEQGQIQTEDRAIIDKHQELLTQEGQVLSEHGTAIYKHEQLLTGQGQVLTEHGASIIKHEERLTEQSQKQTEHGASIVKHEERLTEQSQIQTDHGITIVKHEKLLTEQSQVQTEHGEQLEKLSSSVSSLSKEAREARESNIKRDAIQHEQQEILVKHENLLSEQGTELQLLRECLDQEGKNILENTNTILQNHKSSRTYIRTGQVDAVLQKLQEKHIVLLTGGPGDGKSTIAKQVLCELSEDAGCIPVVIEEPNEWNKVVNSKRRLVVYIDDMFGSTNIDSTAIDKWKNKFDLMISSANEGKVSIVISSRKNIITEIRKASHEHVIINPEYEVDLTSNSLTSEEKENMVLQYQKLHAYRARELIGEQFRRYVEIHGLDAVYQFTKVETKFIVESKTYYGFPLTCFLFFEKRDFFQQGTDFFSRPSVSLFNDIEKMRKSSDVKFKMRFFVLAYVFLKGDIHKFREKKKEFKKICERSKFQNWTEVDIEDAVQDLEGVYLSRTNQKNVYTFCHETIKEAVIASFGKLAPDIIIQNCRFKTIREHIRTEDYEAQDGEVILTLRKKYYPLLSKRLLKESTFYLACHPATDDPEFIKVLFDVINKSNENSRTIIINLWNNLMFFDKPFLYQEILTRCGPHHIKNETEYGSDPSLEKHDGELYLEGPFIRWNVKDMLDGLIFWRCKQSAISIIRYVISNCDVDYFLDSYIWNKSISGMSVLHYCVAGGSTDVVNEIMKVVTPTKTENGWSCLHFAAFFGRVELLKTFEKICLNALEPTGDGCNILQVVLLGLRHGLNSFNFYLSKLESFDKSMKLREITGKETDFISIIKHLTTQYPSLNTTLDTPLDCYQNNIIHYLVIHNRLEIYDMLVEKKNDLIFHRSDTDLPTTLHVAAYLGRVKFVEKLWKAGVRAQGTDLSVTDSIESGKLHSNKNMKYVGEEQKQDNVATNVVTIRKKWVNPPDNVAINLKLKCILDQQVQFGSTTDYSSISSILQS